MILALEEAHGQNHGVFIGLGLDGADLPVAVDPVHAHETEGVLPVGGPGEELPVPGTDEIDEEGLAVAGLAHQDIGHLLGRAPFGRVLDIGHKGVDLVVKADDMLPARPEDPEIVGGLPVDDHLFDVVFQNHPGDPLKGVFEASLPGLHRGEVMLKGADVSHISSHPYGFGVSGRWRLNDRRGKNVKKSYGKYIINGAGSPNPNAGAGTRACLI